MNKPASPDLAAGGPSASTPRPSVGATLAALGVRPNHLTVAGFLATAAGGVLLAFAAGDAVPWTIGRPGQAVSLMPLWIVAALTVAALFDTLDGAVARGGNLKSDFGAVLDSTLDRLSDVFIFAGCAVHFAWTGNLTLVVVALLALTNAYTISYVKARAENLIPACGVGFWQRPERCVSFLVAAFLGQVPAGLWLLATLPAFTVLRRIRHAHTVCKAVEAGSTPPAGRKLSRRSLAYLAIAAGVVAFLLLGAKIHPLLAGQSDPLRILLQR